MSDNNVIVSSDRRRVPGARRAEAPSSLAARAPRAGRPRTAAPAHDLASSPNPPLAADWGHRAGAAGEDIVLCLHGSLADIEPEWRAFERCADCTIFQTFDWLAAWQRHVGARNGTVPAIVFGRDRHGRLLFVLPLAIEPRGPLRCLTWLGSRLCDYNAPLLGEHFSDEVNGERFARLWRQALDLMRAQRRFRFAWIDLQKMPEMIGRQRNPFLGIKLTDHRSGAHAATLGGDWEQYYVARRSAATRKKECTQLKHLAERGDVRFVDAKDRADIERTLEILFGQKSRSFARMRGEDLMARPGYRAFYRDIATSPNTRSLVHVSRLDVGTTPAATSVGLRHRDCYYLVLSGCDDGELSRFGAPRAHLYELIRYAIASGFRRFDLTVGDEPYKRDWSDTELRLCDYLAAATLGGRLAVAMVSALRRTKGLIKQNPTLWRVFGKARLFTATTLRRR